MIRPRDIFQASEAAAAGIKARPVVRGQGQDGPQHGHLRRLPRSHLRLGSPGRSRRESGVVALLCLATVIGTLLTIVILRLLALRIVKQPINHEEKR